jgi:uncharacterized membrane protein
MEEIFPFFDMAELRLTALIGGAAFVFVFALYLVGRIISRRRHDSIIPLLFAIAGFLALVAIISIILDTQPTLPATVVEKREVTSTEPDGTWQHDFRVVTQFTVPGASQPRTEDLNAEEGLYDSLTAGDAIEVRFWDAGGWFEFTRLASRSSFSIVRQSGVLTFSLLIAGVLLFGLLVAQKTGDKTNGILAGGVLIVLGVFAWQMGSISLQLLPLGGPQATAVATIRDINLYTEIRSSENDDDETVLIQPFELVEVTFVPEDWRDPVVALDRIDAESLPLEIGGTVPVVYRTDLPRQIRIQDGSRTYAWKNPLYTLAVWAIIIAVLFLLWRRRRRRPQKAKQNEA